MEKQVVLFFKKSLAIPFILLMLIGFQQKAYSTNSIVLDTIGYNSYRGIVLDEATKKPLVYATITVNETNLSTVTNSKGEFLLKIPKKNKYKMITVSFLGYTSKVVNLSDFKNDEVTISLDTYVEALSEVKITKKDAPALVKEVFKRKGVNYLPDNTIMTGFYRETILKRNTYVSLAEAILIINKQSYTVEKSDAIKLYKSRKNTNYEKLDTLALKHSGGPYDMIRLDIIKNPDLLLTDEMFANYNFTFDKSTQIDDRVIYVVNFKPKKESEDALFFGKLYIDAQSLALTSVQFQLNVLDQQKATDFFILKKPQNAKVKPIQADYFVNYSEKDGKWFHSYSRIELGFKVDWNKKIFNSNYYSTMELAITDWEPNTSAASIKYKDRLKPSVIMANEASGFSDPEFWGELNVIEPDKPIENAIKKIQKQLEKME
jgi:hypothetical protein